MDKAQYIEQLKENGGTAIHCATKKEFEEVLSYYNPLDLSSERFDGDNEGGKAFHIGGKNTDYGEHDIDGCHGSLHYARSNCSCKDNIITAQEFLKRIKGDCINEHTQSFKMKRSEFKQGKTYTLDSCGTKYIISCSKNGRSDNYISYHKKEESGRYVDHSDFVENADYGEASDEDIYWLQQCIEANAFIPKSQLKRKDAVVDNYSIF